MVMWIPIGIQIQIKVPCERGAYVPVGVYLYCQFHAEFLMIMASGPFTTLDSLEYSPLKDLLEAVKQDRPSILFLVRYTGLV